MIQRLRDYDDLIATLAEARKTQRIPFHTLARRAHLAPSTICDGFAGRHDIIGRNLYAIADALGYRLALVPCDETKEAA